MRVITNGKPRNCCDAVDPREGREWGKPCGRRVVLESRRHMADPTLSYTMHYCKRHAARADQKPGCVLRVENRELL